MIVLEGPMIEFDKTSSNGRIYDPKIFYQQLKLLKRDIRIQKIKKFLKQ
jgi:hypothetical protein